MWLAAEPGYLTPSGDPLDGGLYLWNSGDVFKVAYDAGTGDLWFGRNEAWFRSSDPATHDDPHYAGVSGIVTILLRYFPFTANCEVVLRTTADAFDYTPPAGYLPWGD